MRDSEELERLAAEIAEAEGIPLEQARDAAALEMARLAEYAQDWNAERRAAWYDLRRYAKRWDLFCAVVRAAIWN
jgi:hypothetical protein